MGTTTHWWKLWTIIHIKWWMMEVGWRWRGFAHNKVMKPCDTLKKLKPIQWSILVKQNWNWLGRLGISIIFYNLLNFLWDIKSYEFSFVNFSAANWLIFYNFNTVVWKFFLPKFNLYYYKLRFKSSLISV